MTEPADARETATMSDYVSDDRTIITCPGCLALIHLDPGFVIADAGSVITAAEREAIGRMAKRLVRAAQHIQSVAVSDDPEVFDGACRGFVSTLFNLPESQSDLAALARFAEGAGSE